MKKLNFKLIKVLLTLSIVIPLFPFNAFALEPLVITPTLPLEHSNVQMKTTNSRAEDYVCSAENNCATSGADSKPQIDIQYLGHSPSEPMGGDTITFTYKLTAHPFEYFRKQEIVLLLDMSGSMGGDKMADAKAAMVDFVESMRSLPSVEIALVTYNISARVAVPFTSMENADTLISEINKIQTNSQGNTDYALKDGTNIGDALRIASALLNSSDPSATKTLISMTDGQPTNWTSSAWSSAGNKGQLNDSLKYDTLFEFGSNQTIDDIYAKSSSQNTNKNGPYYAGNPNQTSDTGTSSNGHIEDNVSKSQDYALKVATDVVSKSPGLTDGEKYTVYTIGYKLNNATKANLQAVHNATGAPDDNFIAGTEIGEIYKELASAIKSEYSFEDSKINSQIPDGLDPISGITVDTGIDGHTIDFAPIKYNLDRENWIYNADPSVQIITFQVKADINLDKTTDYSVLGGSPTFTYTDVTGKKQDISLDQVNVTVKVDPFDPDRAGKLEAKLDTTENGYLVGDLVSPYVELINRKVDDVSFSDVKFLLTKPLPNQLEWQDNQQNNYELDFGTVDQNSEEKLKESYNLRVADIPSITVDKAEDVLLTGKYSYQQNIESTNNSNAMIEDKEKTIQVKRGEIRVDINHTDTVDLSDLSHQFTVLLEDSKGNQTTGVYDPSQGNYVFNVVQPTGDYSVYVTELPLGVQLEGGSKKSTILSFNNSKQILEFEVSGTAQDSLPSIEASLVSEEVSVVDKDELTLVEYEITPQPFAYSGDLAQTDLDVMFVVDTSLGSEDKVNQITELIQEDIMNQVDHLVANYGLVAFNKTNKTEEVKLQSASDFELNLTLGNASGNGKISQAYEFINKQLSTSNGHEKVLILISDGDLDTNNSNKLSNQGYYPITIDVNGTPSSSLKAFHNEINNEKGIYLSGDIEESFSKVKNYLDVASHKDLTFSPMFTFTPTEHILFETDETQLKTPGYLTCDVGEDDVACQIDDVEYKYELDSKKNQYLYQADPFTVSFSIKADEYGLHTFKEDGVNILSYFGIQEGSTEIDYLINKRIATPTLSVQGESEIIAQGFYNNNLVLDSTNVESANYFLEKINERTLEAYSYKEIVEDMNYYYATHFRINSEQNKLEITVDYPDDISVEETSQYFTQGEDSFNKLAVYKVDKSEDGVIKLLSPLDLSVNIDKDKSQLTLALEDDELEINQEYIAIYPMIFNVEKATVDAPLNVDITTSIRNEIGIKYDVEIAGDIKSSYGVQIRTYKNDPEDDQYIPYMPDLF